jgi:hypothetical protein
MDGTLDFHWYQTVKRELCAHTRLLLKLPCTARRLAKIHFYLLPYVIITTLSFGP